MNKELELLKELKNKINLTVTGKENIPSQEPAVLISNHNCLKDVFYLPLGIPREVISLISARLIYKRDLQRQQVVNSYLYSMPIEAHGGSAYANICLDEATNLLCKNSSLHIFPEGAYIDDKKHVYKGRTGASRILYSAKEKGITAHFIPVAIDVKQTNNDLDNFNFSSSDEVNIQILEPINYDEYFYQYEHSDNYHDKNEALHLVVDDGMKSIAQSLGREYVDEYIELFPKGNVIFKNGDKIETSLAQGDEYIRRYLQEVEERRETLEKRLLLRK